MKVLLLQPPKAARALLGDDWYRFEPLALEYLAAGLRADHDVRLLDLRLEPDLQRTLTEFAPDVVGVTAYTVQVNPALELCRQCKAFDPTLLTVVGGHHATVRPQDLRHPAVDLVVVGAGVAPLREIVRRREQRLGFDGIPGVLQKSGDQLIGEPAPVEADLDAGPLPDRSISHRYRPHYFSEWMKPLATIRTSKGCPFRCTFCSLWRLTGGRYLTRSPESIVAELRTIEEPNVFFADDESMINVKGLDRLADLIAQEKIHKRYFCYGRSDTIVRHQSLIEKWRDIGLARVFVGVEAFRDQDLVAVNKKSTVATNEQALHILAQLGIEAYTNFMVRPDYEVADFRAFRRYTRSQPIPFAGFTVLTPLPGTQLFEEQQALLTSRNWDHFDMMHAVVPTRLPLADFYREYADLMQHALALRQQMAFVLKYPLREWFGLGRSRDRLLANLRNAHLDSTPTTPLPANPGQG